MVKILDIIRTIIGEFNKCVSAKHYLGGLPEGYNAPAFLYLLVFNGDKRESYYTKDVTLDVQIIYFGHKDSTQKTSLTEQLEVMHKLKNFLSQFNLQVGSRNLKFDYNFGEADEQLVINTNFRFADGVVNPKEIEEASREMIEIIHINDERVI